MLLFKILLRGIRFYHFICVVVEFFKIKKILKQFWTHVLVGV